MTKRIAIFFFSLFISLSVLDAHEAFLTYKPQLPVKQTIDISCKYESPDPLFRCEFKQHLEAFVAVDHWDAATLTPTNLVFNLQSFSREDGHLTKDEKKAVAFFKHHPLNINLANHSIGLSMEGKHPYELVEQAENMPTSVLFTDYDLFANLFAHIGVMSGQPLTEGCRFRFAIIDAEANLPLSLIVSESEADVFFEYTITAINDETIEGHIENMFNSQSPEDDPFEKIEGTIIWKRDNALLFDLQLKMGRPPFEGEDISAETHLTVTSALIE